MPVPVVISYETPGLIRTTELFKNDPLYPKTFIRQEGRNYHLTDVTTEAMPVGDFATLTDLGPQSMLFAF